MERSFSNTQEKCQTQGIIILEVVETLNKVKVFNITQLPLNQHYYTIEELKISISEVAL